MKKVISLLLTVLFIVSSLVLQGCTNKQDLQLKNSDTLSIVTTIFPYYDFVKNIVGDRAEVKLLLSPGSEPHDYEPSPSDIIDIENCDIFIYNGGESDEWVNSVLESLQNDIKALKMTDFVELLCGEEHEHSHEHDDAHEHHEEFDEHIWTSPANAVDIVEKICNNAVACDKENALEYEKNAKSYIQKLNSLDEEFKTIVSNASRNTLVFADRFPFLYLTEEYGLEHIAAFAGCSSETEPGISTVTHLIDYVRENNIPVVFYLEFSDGKIGDLICEDSNAKGMRISSCHNVTKRDFENGVSYISLMQANAKAIKEALS